ncbi:hypothetical protein D3C85_1616030 [compost metagenome]
MESLRDPSSGVKLDGPHARVSSPMCGFSILMTFAPRSAKVCVAQGPATTRVRSKTVKPSSARDKFLLCVSMEKVSNV